MFHYFNTDWQTEHHNVYITKIIKVGFNIKLLQQIIRLITKTLIINLESSIQSRKTSQNVYLSRVPSYTSYAEERNLVFKLRNLGFY